jgi:hypothetical protein
VSNPTGNQVSPNVVDIVKSAGRKRQADGCHKVAVIVSFSAGNGVDHEMTDVINAMSYAGWDVETVTGLSDPRVLIVFTTQRTRKA